MNVYAELGIEPIVNANATLTRFGGSIMSDVVLDAMRDAASAFVDLTELQARVGEGIASLTHNEAALVCAGASAGLALASAACRSVRGGRTEGIAHIGDLDDCPDEFIIQRLHRNPYETAVLLAGGRLREVGTLDGTSRDQLANAISANTAGIVVAPNWPITNWPPGVDESERRSLALPIETVVDIARESGVPVIVDAAAQLPAIDNLWSYTAAGADVVIFSGGKDLRGPANSGLLLGRREFIEVCAANSAPLHGFGRPFKVGKEEMIGVFYALREYLSADRAAIEARYEEVIAQVLDWAADRTDVTAVRDPVGPDCQPLPRVRIVLADRLVGRRDEILTQLLNGRPRVALAASRSDGLWLNPECLADGQEYVVLSALQRVLELMAE